MSITAFHIEAFRPWKPSRSKPIPRRRPPHADHHNVHGDPRLDIQQSACLVLIEQPVPTSGGSNELSVTELDEPPAVSAMGAATSPQAQTQCGSAASDLNRLGDAVTTDVSIESWCSIQEAAGCRSQLENPASSAQQYPGPHELAVIPIDPAILRDEFPSGSNQPCQDIRERNTLWSSQQELPCPYPEPPILPRSISDSDHLSLGLIDENRSATRPQYCERSRQTPPGNNAESNESSRSTREQRCNSDVNHTDQRKRPLNGSNELNRRRTKRQRLEETTTLPVGTSCAGVRFHFLSLPTSARLEFLSWLFEGALPRCTFEAETAASIPPTEKADNTRVQKQVCWAQYPGAIDPMGKDTSDLLDKSRKGMPWSRQEEDLLVELRITRGLPWSDVTKLFSDQYPGRSQGSIQVYWSTKLNGRRRGDGST